MIEYHDPSGDEQDDLLQPDTGLPGDRADALPAHAPPPLGELGPGHTDAAPELHFPGDEIAGPAASADLDPAAPWPDDGEFATWLADSDHARTADATAADDSVGERLRATPEGDALPPADELVDWTLQHLGEADD